MNDERQTVRERRCGMRRVLFAKEIRCIIIVLAVSVSLLSLASCKGMEKIQYVTRTEYVYDTMTRTEYVHDTTKTTEVKIDSVDRLVEKIVYVDSNGIVHEKELERLTHYIHESQEEYKAINQVLEQRISQLQQELSQKEETKVVEKKVYVWWPLWVAVGIVAAIVIAIILLETTMNKLAKQEGE